MENPNIKLSVITVTYNNEDVINDYLTSLLGNLPLNSEIIIIDNNSTDQTREILKLKENIKLIENKENMGFSKGCNLGAKQANGEYLFFLNPDTKILDNTLNKLVEYLEENQDVGIVAPQLVEFNGRVQQSVRKSPTLFGAIKEYYFGIAESYVAYVPLGNDPVEVETVVGGAMLIGRELFKKLGGFNEKYFM